MVVSWCIVAFLRSVRVPFTGFSVWRRGYALRNQIVMALGNQLCGIEPEVLEFFFPHVCFGAHVVVCSRTGDSIAL